MSSKGILTFFRVANHIFPIPSPPVLNGRANMKFYSNDRYHLNDIGTRIVAANLRLIMIKSGKEELLPVLVKIFNLIYTNGTFPEIRAVSLIKTLI